MTPILVFLQKTVILTNLKTYYYNVYGLKLKSEFEIPELQKVQCFEPNAVIKIGSVPNQLKDIKGRGILYEIAEGDFLFKLANIAKYRVQYGTSITIQPEKGADEKEIRLFLLGSVIGALLHQKGMFVLHGSAVAINNLATIFTGVSSAGKSSIAAGMIKKGFSFISDDISVITFEKDSSCYVHTGLPQVKLWKDTLIHLEYDLKVERVRPNLEKYILPISQIPIHSPIKVENIISISVKTSPNYRYQELIGVNKYSLLRRNIYRLQYLNKMQKQKLQFDQLSALSKNTKVFNFERPSSPIQLSSMINFITKEII